MRPSSLRSVLGVAGGLALLALAATPGFARDSAAVIVTVAAGSLTIRPAAVADFRGMTVRIVAPGGHLVLEAESGGEAVTWTAAGAPDGSYRYEAVVVTGDPARAVEVENTSTLHRHRASGVFDVSGGQIAPGRRRGR